MIITRTRGGEFVALLFASALSASCSDGGEGSQNTTSTVSSGASAATGAGSNGLGAASGSDGGSSNSGGTLSLEVGGSDSGSGGTRNPGNGTPESCDGLDNDQNGIIDDVDAGGDGICDCLNIGTLGSIGPWSNGGNIFEAWLNERSPRGAVDLGNEPITAERLEPLDIIVVLHVATSSVSSNGRTAPAHHAFTAAEASALASWIQNGGGVMTTIGYTGDEAKEVVNVNALLAGVGVGYSATLLDLSGDVGTWMKHPVTDGVSNIFTDNGVEPSGDGMVVARGGSQRAALAVKQVGQGRIAVWGDEWITYDSEWADVAGQQVELFWLNLFKWLSPPKECQVPIPPRVK